MSDIRDVVAALHENDDTRALLRTYMGQVEDGRTGDVVIAIGLACEAICAHLASIATRLDYVARETTEGRHGH